MLQKALNFATEAHSGQIRKDGSDFITHPVEVMRILSVEFPIQVSDETKVIALLHDTIEDTAITFEMLMKEFNLSVAGGVLQLTKDGEEYLRARRYEAKLLHASEEIKYIKIADFVHNFRTLKLMKEPGGFITPETGKFIEFFHKRAMGAMFDLVLSCNRSTAIIMWFEKQINDAIRSDWKGVLNEISVV